MLRVAVVGTGVTGTVHARTLAGCEGALLTISVGLEAEGRAFADRFGCRSVPTLDDALPHVDAVVVATPTALHAPMALKALKAGMHVLVEAPMAMSLSDALTLVEIADERGLVLAVSHPLRLRPPLAALATRIAAGDERLLTVNSIFYMASPRAPLGGHSPTWTDNVLWHHMSHGADLIHWLAGGDGKTAAGGMAGIDPASGIPMRAWAAIDLPTGFGLVSADYFGRERNEVLVVTDRDTYHFDQARATFSDRSGREHLTPPLEHLSLVARDFVAAVRDGKIPTASGESVLAHMRSLQYVQDAWDRQYGTVELPGRNARM